MLIAAAALALIVANSPLAEAYRGALDARLGPLSVHRWINDALMSLFFLLVGLEIKRELAGGALARWEDRLLPTIAAAGGMAVPALVYLAVAGGPTGLARGWAIPAATDIAFAIGVMALLGRRVPVALKLFLTTVAIVDDMGAVAIIALAYSTTLDLPALALAAGLAAAMAALNRRGVCAVWPYLLLGAGLWLAVARAGIHPTVAGVATALCVPARGANGDPGGAASPLHRLEQALDAPVSFAVVPLFGFANAGVALGAGGTAGALAPLPLGVALGLFVGKQAGVFASVRLAVALGWARRPAGTSWTQLWGAALLAGIGFTMSLFIGTLAFASDSHVDAVKVGVLAGSIASALAGYAVLRVAGRVGEKADAGASSPGVRIPPLAPPLKGRGE